MSAAVPGETQSSGPDEHAYCAVLQYDGRNFYGWQRLRDHPTIQAELELALEGAFARRVAAVGAGRTDRGAHAEGQVAGFRLIQEHPPETVAAALNQRLPPQIRVVEARRVALSFHACTSAVGKRYQYRIDTAEELASSRAGRVWQLPERLDLASMQRAAHLLLGQQDFASFATKSRFARGSTVRELQEAAVSQRGDAFVFEFQASSFLYHMVRNIVRALVKVGQGRYAPEQITTILAARDRAASPGSAPASGLYLMQVFY
jgi:tRNA pseudouridine38-40 synthase